MKIPEQNPHTIRKKLTNTIFEVLNAESFVYHQVCLIALQYRYNVYYITISLGIVESFKTSLVLSRKTHSPRPRVTCACAHIYVYNKRIAEEFSLVGRISSFARSWHNIICTRGRLYFDDYRCLWVLKNEK